MEFLGRIGRHFKYDRSLDENMNILRKNLEELNNQKEDIEFRLTAEMLHPGKKPKEEVKNWLENVQCINTEAKSIEEKVGERRYLSHAHLGKLIDEMIRKVKKFNQQGGFSDDLADDDESLSETTTNKYVNKIWKYLMGDNVRKIGVCGMKGVGKTTIMKHIIKLLEDSTDKFDNVIWVTVSRELDVITLQNDIAQALNQDLSKHEDKPIRTQMLLKMFEEKKRYVLILDNMWKSFSLEEVGIPEPTEINGCKIVLTTQFRNVCQNMDEVIKVGLLTKEEAWNLFLDEVGRDVLNIPKMEAIVKRVAEQCFCLPLAIITIASSMKEVYDIYEWRNALDELRRCIKGAKGMESKVSEKLKFGYDRLCFLYCTLYPKDFAIPERELIGYWIDEGLVGEITSREAKYDRGRDVLNTFEKKFLLESTKYKSLKMSDLVRDIAMNITRTSPRFMVKAGMQLKELPNEQEWTKDLEKVSLMRNSISKIPSGVSPKCQRLSTLLLQGNPLKSISDSFFVHMSGLKVLDLSYTDILNLPNSISDLENLTTLLLRECWALKYVPSLAKLRSLRTLDLSYTTIGEVPQGMEMLVNLRCLNLCAKFLKTIPGGILPKLFRLQCLIVWWGSDTLKIKGNEVVGLRKLETFVCQFYDLHDFNIYVRSLQGGGPHKFHLQVGPSDPFYMDRFIDFEEEGRHFSKHVALRDCRISRGGNDPLVLPNDIEFLNIKTCHDVSSLGDVSSLKTDLLKYCEISSCDGIICVVWSSSYDRTPLQSLKVLNLYRLQNLRVLFMVKGASSPPSPPTPGTFSHLKELNIQECPNIKKLFTLGLLPHLQNLEVISVKNCEGMEELIAATEGDQGMVESSNNSIVNTFTFPKLRLLELCNLPELKSIVHSGGIMVCDSLQLMSVDRCLKLKRLPLSISMRNGQPSPPPSLKCISVDDKEWWEALEWDPPYAKNVLQRLIRDWWTGRPV